MNERKLPACFATAAMIAGLVLSGGPVMADANRWPAFNFRREFE